MLIRWILIFPWFTEVSFFDEVVELIRMVPFSILLGIGDIAIIEEILGLLFLHLELLADLFVLLVLLGALLHVAQLCCVQKNILA